MPLDEFLLVTARQRIGEFIIKHLTEVGHAVTVDEMTNHLMEKAEKADDVADRRFRTLPSARPIMRREVVNIVHRLAFNKTVVMISDDRFSLPGQKSKYRTLDDYWET